VRSPDVGRGPEALERRQRRPELEDCVVGLALRPVARGEEHPHFGRLVRSIDSLPQPQRLAGALHRLARGVVGEADAGAGRSRPRLESIAAVGPRNDFELFCGSLRGLDIPDGDGDLHLRWEEGAR
jgi:hypothetical protein